VAPRTPVEPPVALHLGPAVAPALGVQQAHHGALDAAKVLVGRLQVGVGAGRLSVGCRARDKRE
jgi:hypothetical protein